MNRYNIGALQRQDDFLSLVWDYEKKGTLPDNINLAKQVFLTHQNIVVLNDVLCIRKAAGKLAN